MVIVDAGHGGSDPGAIGNGLQEKDLNLKAAEYMFERLTQLGIPAVITRSTDESLPKNARIQRIQEIIRESGDPSNIILISNHINAGGAEGAEIVYALRNDSTLADLALDYIGEAGQIKRKTYQRRLPENPNRDYYYIIRETAPAESLLVEYGFIDNARDAQKLQNNITDYAEAVVKAIAEYTNTPYTPEQLTGDFYVVKKGDTIYKIANQFNIPISEIKRINNLTSDLLNIGQILYLKESTLPNNYFTYTVKKGDSLWKIAQENNTSIDDIKRINNLTSNNLIVGQQLLIPLSVKEPDNSITQPTLPTGPSSTTPVESYIIYEVKKGDSLWKIANDNNTTVNDLIKLNNLSNLTLQIGDKIKIPTSQDEKPTRIYIVKSGDTLWSIAKANGVSVNELKSANNLTNNLLSLGQELIIPQ